MDVWIGMLVVWGVVELIQFLRKRPFPARMKTGAKAGVFFAWMVLLGGMSKTTMDNHYWFGMATTLLMAVTVATLIYWLRVLLAKVWGRMFPNKEVPLN